MRVIGLGTQDSLPDAREFVEDTGVSSIQMLWDASSRSWRSFGVTGQPAWAVLTKEGKELDTWFGDFDQARVLKLATGG